MEHQDILLTLAQISLAFAGLVSTMFAVRTINQPLDPRDILGFKLILEHNIAQVFLSLLPIILGLWLTGHSVWQISSWTFAVFPIYQLFISLLRAKKIQSRVPRIFTFFFVPMNLLLFVIQVWNAWTLHLSALFIGPLVWLMIPPSIQFGIYLRFSWLPYDKIPSNPTQRANAS